MRELRLESAPRNPLAFIADDDYLSMYLGRMFPRRLMNVWSNFLWLSGVVRGSESAYSADDPMRILTRDPNTCIKVLAIMGYDTDWLALQSITKPEIVLPREEAVECFSRFIRCFWEHEEIRASEIYDVVRQHRAHEDFTDSKSTVRIDFHRQYYHTRAKIKTVNIADAWEDAEYIPDTDHDIDNIVLSDWIERFFATLGNDKDVEICKLLYIGCTQQQIADSLGYKNHSGVNKRIAHIKGKLSAYIGYNYSQ